MHTSLAFSGGTQPQINTVARIDVLWPDALVEVSNSDSGRQKNIPLTKTGY